MDQYQIFASMFGEGEGEGRGRGGDGGWGKFDAIVKNFIVKWKMRS